MPGACTWKMNDTRTAVGTVSSVNRNADSPIARYSHIHCTETGLIRFMAMLPSIIS